MGLKVLEKIGFFRYKSKILPTNMTNFFLEKNNSVFFFFRKVEKKNTADFTHSLLSPEDPAKRIFSREKKKYDTFGSNPPTCSALPNNIKLNYLGLMLEFKETNSMKI